MFTVPYVTPLHLATQRGQLQVAQQLLADGADVNRTEFGMTPLSLALRAGHTKVVQKLVAAGADVKTANSVGSTPLHLAAVTGQHEVVQLLLAAGADVNAVEVFGETPLQSAAVGHFVVVQQLLRSGADPQLRVVGGRTTFYWTALSGYTDIVQLLLEAWGQPAITAADLIQAAKAAARNQRMATFAWLVKELQRLYPAELHVLFEGQQHVSSAVAVAAVLNEWAADVSSRDEQRAALHRQEEDVVRGKQAVQQLIVGMASMARNAQPHLA